MRYRTGIRILDAGSLTTASTISFSMPSLRSN
jgi:hypothetical protein